MRYTTNHGEINLGPSNGCRESSHGSESSGGAALPRPTMVPIVPRIERTDDLDRSAYAPLAARIAAARA